MRSTENLLLNCSITRNVGRGGNADWWGVDHYLYRQFNSRLQQAYWPRTAGGHLRSILKRTKLQTASFGKIV
jgi:hypothetical protein